LNKEKQNLEKSFDLSVDPKEELDLQKRVELKAKKKKMKVLKEYLASEHVTK